MQSLDGCLTLSAFICASSFSLCFRQEIRNIAQLWSLNENVAWKGEKGKREFETIEAEIRMKLLNIALALSLSQLINLFILFV